MRPFHPTPHRLATRLVAALASASLLACNTPPKIQAPASAPPPASTTAAGALPSSPPPVAAAPAAPAPTSPARSCKSLNEADHQTTAAAVGIGALAGALLGGVAGKRENRGRNRVTGALVGALVGALASSAFKDKIPVDEMPDGSVRLRIPGSVMFASGRHELSPQIQATLTEVGSTLRQYCDLSLHVVGHTDNIGSAASNKALSERRAGSVVAHFRSMGFDPGRMSFDGKGFEQPAAPNTDEASRALNRRVEVFVRPPAA